MPRNDATRKYRCNTVWLSPMILIFILLSSLSACAIQDLKLEMSPSYPKAGEVVKFYLNTTCNITMARLWIEECGEEQCYLPKIVDMEETAHGSYLAEHRLHNNTISICYKAIITLWNGSVVETDVQEVKVKSESPMSNENLKRETPGYEFLDTLISFLVLILLSKRLSR